MIYPANTAASHSLPHHQYGISVRESQASLGVVAGANERRLYSQAMCDLTKS